jgi:L-lactate dehydrogenase complex protein LldE
MDQFQDRGEKGRLGTSPPRVGIFVTCLVDLFRPNIGYSTVRLLTNAGCRIEVPPQTCCGQPAFNNGDRETARACARQVVAAFAGFDYVVVPSGSCAGMLKVHYPALFPEGSPWHRRTQEFADRTHELVSFLGDIWPQAVVHAVYPGMATYHDSCSGLRELGIRHQPRRLLARVSGLTLREMANPEVCCGFGGTFCLKYPEISARLAADKTAAIEASGAGTVLGGDLGCLLHIAGRLRRIGSRVKVYHVAEMLAGRTSRPALGEGQEP